MKLLSLARAAGVAFALVLLGAVAQANLAGHWNGTTPSVQGPWLGDTNVNIYTLWTATTNQTGRTYWPALSVSQTAAQANCTQLNTGVSEVKTSAATGYVCLPTGNAGRVVMIGNASGQTIDIYGSASTAVSGTQDTINGTVGTTAYTGLTTGKSTVCFTANAGAWYCGSVN